MTEERRGYRWHRSSLFVMLVILLGFILVAVPGVSGDCVHFGWPYVHYILCEQSSADSAESLREAVSDRILRATVNNSRSLVPATHRSWSMEHKGFWSDLGNWSYVRPQAAGRVLWLGLAVNLMIAIGTIVLVGALFECRRRRRRSLLQLRITDLLAMTLLLGAVLGMSQLGRSQQRRDEHRVDAMSRQFPLVIDGYSFGLGGRSTPIWLARLSDEKIDQWDGSLRQQGLPTLTQVFGRSIPVTELRVRGQIGFGSQPLPFDQRALANSVNELEALDSLWLIGCNSEQLELLEHVDPEPVQAVHIYASGSDISVQDLKTLARFRHLRRLELFDVELRHQQHLDRLHLNELEELIVSADCVGEQGWAWIASLPQLRIVYLRSRFRLEHLDAIRKRLPHVHITVDLEMLGGLSAF